MQELGAHSLVERGRSESACKISNWGHGHGVYNSRDEGIYTQQWFQALRTFNGGYCGDGRSWSLHQRGKSSGDQHSRL